MGIVHCGKLCINTLSLLTGFIYLSYDEYVRLEGGGIDGSLGRPW